MSKVGLVADALHRFVCRYLCEVLQGYPDLSLSSFIGAAKPDLKPTQLVVVEEKLGKVRPSPFVQLTKGLSVTCPVA